MLEVLSQGEGQCANGASVTVDAYFVPATVTALPGPGQGAADLGTTGCTVGVQQAPGCIASTSWSPPSEAQQDSGVASALQNSADNSFVEALCQSPGSPCPNVPPPYTAKIPDPTPGESWSDYQTDLSNASITNVQQSTATGSAIDLDEPAGAVISVSPAPGAAIFPVTTPVIVTTNPTTMPTVPQRVEDLATELEATNPGINERNKLDIARQCLALEDQATGNSDFTEDNGDTSFQNCTSLPIFITGYDAKSAGQHDEIALGMSNVTTDPSLTFSAAYGGISPGWVALSRDVTGKSDSWKNSLEPCSSTTPPNGNCDEYPFLSSQQGGGGVSPQPNLQYILGTQNQLQGTRLNQVLQLCNADQPRHQRLQHHLRHGVPRSPSSELLRRRHNVGLQRKQPVRHRRPGSMQRA